MGPEALEEWNYEVYWGPRTMKKGRKQNLRRTQRLTRRRQAAEKEDQAKAQGGATPVEAPWCEAFAWGPQEEQRALAALQLYGYNRPAQQEKEVVLPISYS